ncbi:hypothetical protein EDD15DRAFT_2204558 [Pisolithus albus]|nr:hypothetical protein EDD15DRAFT_2204558 [Pisolithus albus]
MSARSGLPYVESNLSFPTAKGVHRGASVVEERGDVPNARGGGKGKLNSLTPSSTGKATRSKLSPYHKRQYSCPQVTFMQTALAGAVCPHPSTDGGAGKLYQIEDTKKKTTRMELEDMHLPGDILREAVMAQYADCEATRYRILTATWEIERLERWKRFFDRSLNHLKEKNTTSVSRFEFFKKCCLDLGGDEGRPEERSVLMEATQRDASALGVMQKEFKDAEEVAISLGVFDDTEESRGFYFGVADSSDAEESNRSSSGIPYGSFSAASDPEAPPPSDPEIPYSSDPEVPFPTGDSSDVEWFQMRKQASRLTTCLKPAMRSNRGRKLQSMQKPPKGSGLNPCLQPDTSQLGIPSEFTQDPMAIPQPALNVLQEEIDGYNHETSVSAFVGSDNYPRSSMVQERLWPSTNFLPATSSERFIPPPIAQGIPSYTASQFPVALAPYLPAGDALPLCEAADGHVTVAPISLPTPSSSSYPRRLSTEASAQISQIARPNPYPIISSGIRRVFAYGPRRPSESERGAFVNIGVIRTGTDREITGRRATRRTLLPSQAISETDLGQPSASYQALPPSPHASPPRQQNEAAARTISEMEAARLSQVVVEAKHGMRRRLICRNAFPSQLEALSFAEDALAEAVSKVIGTFEYSVDQSKDKKIISQVARIIDPVRTLFKNVARAQIREAVRLRVEYLLQDHNFLYTDLNQEFRREFGHCALTHTLISSVWTMPGAIAKSLDTNDAATINGLVALAGAALGSALGEFQEGRLSTTEFSSNTAGKQYVEITRLISSMLQNEQQRFPYKTYCENIVLLGSTYSS